MLIYVCTHAVKVMTILPDRVLKWIGGGQDALGAASDMQGHMNKVMGVVVASAKPDAGPGKKTGGGIGGNGTGGVTPIDKEAGPQ